MQCAQCGEPIPAGARFCGACGAHVDAPPAAAPETDAPRDLVGQLVAGRYKLLRRIAEGGMGSVYEGEQTLGASRRSVAVKLLRPELSNDASVKARFEREAATVARLEHFNTVRVYDFGTAEDGALFLVMEYIEGRSLQSVLDEAGALPAERVVRIASQVAASLDEAHRLGIVHRDLKPDNILLIESYASERDVVKLVDFGIAKGQPTGGKATTKLTELGTFVGTPAYMSPEQFSGGSGTARSDIYSLGVTAHQMLSGELPFQAASILEWAQAHLNAAPPPLGADRGAGPIPEHMQRAVLRALSKDPEARQISAAQFAIELSGRGGTDQTQAAAEQPSPAVIPDTPGAPREGAAGPMKTAPMTQLPDVAGARGPAPTQAMAALPLSPARAAGVPLAPTLQHGAAGRARRGRGWLWLSLAVLIAGGTVLALSALRVTPWQLALRPEPAPPPLFPPPDLTATSPTPEQPAPEPPAPEPPPSSSPSGGETTRPPAPAPPAAPAAPPPATSAPPTWPPGTPQLPLPPGAPLPTTPAPSPAPSPTTPPGLPQLPWSLPTAGACERCLAALRGAGNYIIVNAVAEGLLCEDRTARETCERQIAEMAPAVAERAARGGDCPAALATAAAAMNVRVSPDQFAAVNALCLR